MKKVFENKILVGGICIVVAAILAFLILPSMYKQKEKTIFICRLMSDIPAGTKIETEMLKLVEVGSYGLPETVVKNTDDIVGKYAKVSMIICMHLNSRIMYRTKDWIKRLQRGNDLLPSVYRVMLQAWQII